MIRAKEISAAELVEHYLARIAAHGDGRLGVGIGPAGRPPFGPDAEELFMAVWGVLALSPVPPERESELLPLTRWLREQGRATAPDRLLAAPVRTAGPGPPARPDDGVRRAAQSDPGPTPSSSRWRPGWSGPCPGWIGPPRCGPGPASR